MENDIFTPSTKSIKIIFIYNLIISIVLLALLMVYNHFHLLVPILNPIAIRIITLSFIIYLVIMNPIIATKKRKLRLTENYIEIESQLFKEKLIMIPYASIQSVAYRKGIISRLFNLYSIQLYTIEHEYQFRFISHQEVKKMIDLLNERTMGNTE